MFSLVNNLGQIVREKQTKMREYLKIIGIKSHVYWLSSFLRLLLVYLLLALIATILGFVELSPKRNDPRLVKKVIFKHVDAIVVFMSLTVYSIQSSIFTLLFSQLFSKRKLFLIGWSKMFS